MNSIAPAPPAPPAPTPAPPPEKPEEKKTASNIKWANALYELVHVGYQRARDVKERAKQLEAIARDLEGSIISASSVNQTDPERAATLLQTARQRFVEATKEK